MITLGSVIGNATLADHASAKKSIEQAMQDTYRFDRFLFQNRTQDFTCFLCLFQGIDESGQALPPGYQTDTGVTVGGVNVTPGSDQTTILQPQVRVLATRVKVSYQVRHIPSGQEQTINAPDQVAQPGHFFLQAGIRISQNASFLAGADPISVTLEATSASRSIVHLKK